MGEAKQRLERLGGLHDANITNISQDDASRTVLVYVDDAYANFSDHYASYPGIQPMIICCKGVSWCHHPEVPQYPLWVGDVYIELRGDKKRLCIQSTTAFTPIIVECDEIDLLEVAKYDFADDEDPLI